MICVAAAEDSDRKILLQFVIHYLQFYCKKYAIRAHLCFVFCVFLVTFYVFSNCFIAVKQNGQLSYQVRKNRIAVFSSIKSCPWLIFAHISVSFATPLVSCLQYMFFVTFIVSEMM
jgi:hypothetical protein